MNDEEMNPQYSYNVQFPLWMAVVTAAHTVVTTALQTAVRTAVPRAVYFLRPSMVLGAPNFRKELFELNTAAPFFVATGAAAWCLPARSTHPRIELARRKASRGGSGRRTKCFPRPF